MMKFLIQFVVAGAVTSVILFGPFAKTLAVAGDSIKDTLDGSQKPQVIYQSSSHKARHTKPVSGK